MTNLFHMEVVMETNCKKWKYLLITTAVAVSFSAVPQSVYAADTKTKITDNDIKTKETTADKMNSNNTTAGPSASPAWTAT